MCCFQNNVGDEQPRSFLYFVHHRTMCRTSSLTIRYSVPRILLRTNCGYYSASESASCHRGETGYGWRNSKRGIYCSFGYKARSSAVLFYRTYDDTPLSPYAAEFMLVPINVHRLRGYAIDIDRASFGHNVVEIEAMSTPEKEDLLSARDSVTALARSVGAQQEGTLGRPVKVKCFAVG